VFPKPVESVAKLQDTASMGIDVLPRVVGPQLATSYAFQFWLLSHSGDYSEQVKCC
jgi:hypothetical protein